ncbi:MAG: SLC13/DASS family transporter [Gammaproteobacteria bacterium]|nr:SLC13/DASS family transporter [Gammaproteobacteria bacterium]
MWWGGLPTAAWITGSVTTLVVIWWMLEPIPIPVTSLIPLFAFPLFGVIEIADVRSAYGHPLILLLLGGFILSTAMAKSGLHKRLAFVMLRVFGATSGRRLVMGFMATAAILSMWMSNTATTLMLLPVALAILDRINDPRLVAPLLLGTAHAASVGGIGTPIGTPPNVVFLGVYSETTGTEIGFFEWMTWGVPVVVLIVPLLALWLTRHVNYKTQIELPKVGKWTQAEVLVLAVFTLTALLWITRKLPEPFFGWSHLFGDFFNGATSDYMAAFFAIVLLFLIPDGKGGKLLDWETATTIPWGMLILFGAGLSIATAFTSSGLSEILGTQLQALDVLPVIVVVIIICVGVTFLTEATSNTATTTLLLPILGATAVALAVDPKYLMVPATMSASCAFMLPVATPPNVVVFSSGRFPIEKMAQEGFVLNLIGAAVISTMCFFYFGL